VLNALVRERDYWQIVDDAQPVSLQLSTVTAIVAAFLHLRRGWGAAPAVLAISVLVMLAGHLLVRFAAGGKG